MRKLVACLLFFSSLFCLGTRSESTVRPHATAQWTTPDLSSGHQVLRLQHYLLGVDGIIRSFLFSSRTTTCFFDQSLSFKFHQKHATTIELDCSVDALGAKLDEIESKVNEHVRANVQVQPVEYSVEQALDLPSLGLPELRVAKKGLPDGLEKIRVVTIDGLESNACCGTHVQNLGALRASCAMFVTVVLVYGHTSSLSGTMFRRNLFTTGHLQLIKLCGVNKTSRGTLLTFMVSTNRQGRFFCPFRIICRPALTFMTNQSCRSSYRPGTVCCRKRFGSFVKVKHCVGGRMPTILSVFMRS